MTIASEITRIKNNISNAYTACSNKGATMPVEQDSDNLSTTIGSIPTGGTIDSLSITPTTSEQTITASGGVDGYSPITVNAVTSSIDANISAGNIKSGVSILGVTGNVTELNGSTETVTPTTSQQTITPTSPSNGLTSVTVNAVTSSIDANIQAGNIKDGVSILGVTGTYTGVTKLGIDVGALIGNVSSGVLSKPTSTFTLDFSGITEIGENALQNKFMLPSLDLSQPTNHIINTENITTINDYGMSYCCQYKKFDSIDLSSLTTVGSNGMEYAFYFSQIGSSTSTLNLSSLTTVGNFGMRCSFTQLRYSSVDLSSLVNINNTTSFFQAFMSPYLTSFDLSALETISGQSACNSMFSGATELKNIFLPSLISINGQSACNSMFESCGSSSSITELIVDLSALETINGNTACQTMFYGCSKLKTITFDSLNSIYSSSVCNQMFANCSRLQSISFPSLTTTSFGSTYVNQFNNMFNSTTASKSGAFTMHFPSNLQTTIAGLTGYPNFGATAGRLTLAFDLPATT